MPKDPTIAVANITSQQGDNLGLEKMVYFVEKVFLLLNII
jgi:hypothetical protein